MLQIIKGGGVLLLLAAFFAYTLVPIVGAIRSRVLVGRRRRPAPVWAVLGALYVVIFGATSLVWRASAPQILDAINVSGPAAIDHLFGSRMTLPETAFARLPAPAPLRSSAARIARSAVSYLEREVRATFDDLLAAARYASWLGVVPIVTFILITAVPGFRRSADRLLPHGHLQWRAGEYLRDVNSTLAGYVRAQLAAAVIVGGVSTLGFLLLRLRFPWTMGIVAGLLEPLPVIGPVAVLLMVAGQADRVLGVVAFLGGLRVVQDYAIYPRLIRHGMHMPALVVVLSVWSGAALAGASGVILALPVAGLISISARHWRQYRAIERLVRDHARRVSQAAGDPRLQAGDDRPAEDSALARTLTGSDGF